MAAVDGMLRANELYAAAFAKGDLQRPPSRRVAVLTCMDARLDPAKFLGLAEGDAHVIRNAGGRASDDALRSLFISQQMLGTREVVVIHHTDCGMLTFTNEDANRMVRERLDPTAPEMDFLPFPELTQGVRDDVRTIRESPLIPDDIPVTGWIYDVHTGRLDRVE
jgi:carbonic anhydrase